LRRFVNTLLGDLFRAGEFILDDSARRRWARSRAARGHCSIRGAERQLILDSHILDYGMLDSVHLGFGEIYADH
jgi:hypothetical protein